MPRESWIQVFFKWPQLQSMISSRDRARAFIPPAHVGYVFQQIVHNRMTQRSPSVFVHSNPHGDVTVYNQHVLLCFCTFCAMILLSCHNIHSWLFSRYNIVGVDRLAFVLPDLLSWRCTLCWTDVIIFSMEVVNLVYENFLSKCFELFHKILRMSVNFFSLTYLSFNVWSLIEANK